MDDQYALDWDCTPDWDDIEIDDLPHIPPDLGGQGLTSRQLHTMTSVEPTGNYL